MCPECCSDLFNTAGRRGEEGARMAAMCCGTDGRELAGVIQRYLPQSCPLLTFFECLYCRVYPKEAWDEAVLYLKELIPSHRKGKRDLR